MTMKQKMSEARFKKILFVCINFGDTRATGNLTYMQYLFRCKIDI